MQKHLIHRSLRQFNLGDVVGKGYKQAVVLHLGNLAIQPVMLVNGYQSQKLNVSGALIDRAQLLAHLLCVAVKQEVAKSLFKNHALLCPFQAIEIHLVLGAYGTYRLCELYIVFVFSHVVFLLWVGGVAAITLAGYGVAFYLWGAV